MQRTTIRRAKAPKLCSGHRTGAGAYDMGNRAIQPGQLYAEHVASPDHDGMGNQRWWRMIECSDCYQQRMGKPLAQPVTAGVR
jgi:hypothetical protein